MKINAINTIGYRQNFIYNKQSSSLKTAKETAYMQDAFYYPMDINFKAANAAPLRRLFSYGLPDMYTGLEMIDALKCKDILKNNNVNQIPAKVVCGLVEQFKECLDGTELEVFNLIKSRSEEEPNKTIQGIMQSLSLQYEYELVKKQLPIFKTLNAYSYSLPLEQREQFNKLMKETSDKISRRPIITRFSVTEFKYKLDKVKQDYGKLHDKKSLGLVNHIIKQTDNFAPKTNEKNIYNQRKILADIEKLINRTELKDNQELQDLIQVSKAKMDAEKVLIPFSRKAFIYDLSQIIKTLDDSNLKETFMKIAEKIPTSRDSIAAYITKNAHQSSEKIILTLLSPFFATVEHLHPKSLGGADDMYNYGGASSRSNSDRQNRPFTEQVSRIQLLPTYCQKYIDRLIDYALTGIFEEENIDIKYIEDFKNTIAAESEGAVLLDTSRLYKNGRFQKPKSAFEIV